MFASKKIGFVGGGNMGEALIKGLLGSGRLGADQILVSLNTVRTHVKHIYGKLLVHKRSQAIAKARELELL